MFLYIMVKRVQLHNGESLANVTRFEQDLSKGSISVFSGLRTQTIRYVVTSVQVRQSLTAHAHVAGDGSSSDIIDDSQTATRAPILYCRTSQRREFTPYQSS